MIRQEHVFIRPAGMGTCGAAWGWIKMFARTQGLPFIGCLLSIVAQNMIWLGMYGVQGYMV